MLTHALAFIAGGVFLTLFFRVNPKYAAKFFKIADKIESKIEEKTGKNI